MRIIPPIVAVLLVALVGCAPVHPATRGESVSGSQVSTSTDVRRVETAQQIAARLNLPLTEQTKSLEQTIPASLDGLPWALYQSAAVQGGYDLKPYAGKRVTFRRYGIRQFPGGSKQSLWLIESGTKVIGAYHVVEGAVPGISGVGNPR